MSNSDQGSFLFNSQSTPTPILNYQYDDLADNFENENNNDDSYAPKAESLFKSTQTNKTEDVETYLSFESSTAESNEFRIMIVCLGLLIVSIGILSNLLFSLLVICRKRKRQTLSTLLMSSMCLIYLIFLLFYCFKISIYFNVDTIIKFHIYDITENWIYGAFLCKFISSLPICCKLISRLSIFTLVLKRIFSTLLCNENKKASLSHSLDNENGDFDGDVNIIKNNKAKKKKSSPKIKQVNAIGRIFRFPILVLIILIIWLISASATWPIFSSYKLTEIPNSAPICDSIYDFPNDIKTFSSIYFNYLIYALALPCLFILISLILLSILNLINCKPRPSSPQSSSHSTPTKKINKYKTQSFEEIKSCQRTRSNNFLIWIMFIIHLSTSLPQEIYRYLQLTRNDFEDKNVLESYLEMALEKPLIRARPYYSIQLLYISEFAIMPLVFILFYFCSLKLKQKKSESNTALSNSGKRESLITKCFSSCFYDSDLVKSTSAKSIYSDKTILKEQTENSINDALLESNHKINHQYQLNNELQFNNNGKKLTSLKPTPFEIAANSNYDDQSPARYNLTSNVNNNDNSNVLHIIQHPSWRINIKQPSAPTNNNSFNFTNSHLYNNNGNEENISGQVQLPFTYKKTNMYNS